MITPVCNQEPSSADAVRYVEDGCFHLRSRRSRRIGSACHPPIEDVMDGKHEIGREPVRRWNSGDSPTKIRKINDAHISDRTNFDFVTYPEIRRWAAMVTGTQTVQLWASQLLYKPPGGDVAGQVGWHQDYMYWKESWEPDSELFTAWVAVSDVKVESGPMCFVPRSHRWGFLNPGDLFNSDRDHTRAEIHVPNGETWGEVPAILTLGAISLHHCLTYHAGGRNISHSPPSSFALHLRTKKSKPLAGCKNHYLSNLGDPQFAPVAYRTPG
jgi:ectoine hydroxylase-related dioxygenase (phytanoyl-CoA dioxygenase family)